MADGVGISHIVLLSAMGVHVMPDDPTGMAHIEDAVNDAVAPSSILRPNTFMQNFTTGAFAGPIRERGTVVAPVGDAKVSFVSTDDIADVAVCELSEKPTGRTLIWTEPEALSFASAARTLSDVTGRTIDFVDPGPDEMRAILESASVAPSTIALVLGFHATLADGSTRCALDRRARGREAVGVIGSWGLRFDVEMSVRRSVRTSSPKGCIHVDLGRTGNSIAALRREASVTHE